MMEEVEEGTSSQSRSGRCWTNGRSRRPCDGCSRGCSSTSSSRWLLVVCGFFAIAFTNGCFRAITIFMPDFIFEFESSATLMGWIFSIDPFMLGVMTPFAAYFISKFGTRPVVMVSGAFAASGVVMLSLARHISLVGIAIGAVTSTTQATVYASSVLLIRRNFRLHYALAHGIVISGYSCGLFVFPPILEALNTFYSWRGTCLIAAGFMLNTVLMGALMKPPKARQSYVPVELDARAPEEPFQKGQVDSKPGFISQEKREHPMGTDDECHGNGFDSKEECAAVSIPDLVQQGLPCSSKTDATIEDETNKTPDTHSDPILHLDYKPGMVSDSNGNATQRASNADRISVSGVGLTDQPGGCLQRIVSRNYHTFAIYTLSMFCTTMGYNIFLLHVSTSFTEFGVDLREIATCLSVFAAFNLIGRITNGLFVSRGVHPSYLITLAELVAFVSILAVYLCGIFPVRVSAVALYGLSTGFYTTLFYVFHREIVDPKVDVKTLSIFMLMEGLSGPAGGSFGGLLRDNTGNYKLTYMTSAGLSLFAALLMVIVILLERRRKRSSEFVNESDI